MAQSDSRGRALALKQATLPFGRAPPKKPRLEEPPAPTEPSSSPPPASSPPQPINSDDDSEPTINGKLVNPLVPLVDMMLKRKLNKKTRPSKKPKLQTENNETDLANDENVDPHSLPNSINDVHMEDEPLDSEDAQVETSDVIPISDTEDLNSSEGVSDTKTNTTLDDTPNQQEQDGENADNSKNDEKRAPADLLTPKRNTNTPNASPMNKRKLTPKQLEKKLESAKKQRQRELERQEKERKKQEEKEMKAKLKEEKEAQLKKEKEEKEEAKRIATKNKEMSLKLKQQLKEAKEEQKKMSEQAKEDERLRKEEERLRKEEERLRKEQEKEKEEIKKKKAAAAFANFFVPKGKIVKKENKENETLEKFSHNHKFLSNFTIKSDMRLAPTIRRQITNANKENLEKFLLQQDADKNLLYISTIKSNTYEMKNCGKTWPCEEMKNDIVIVEDDLPPVDEMKDESLIICDKHEGRKLRPKLLSFSENRRPPYWGTWRRKSKQINGRRPFAVDTTYLDYTCDSDEEWEEEEPGESVESIAGSDDEGEGENEYDVDNDFMVPHGYLSDEEALGEDDNALSPEALKAKLQYLEHEFVDEMKKPTNIKKPRLIGIVWQNVDGGKPDKCADAVWNFLTQKSILSVEPEIIIVSSTNNTELDLEDGEKSAAKKKKKLSDDMIPDLIKLIHGNTNNRGFLAKEFQTYLMKMTNSKSPDKTLEQNPILHSEISKISILKKIREISTWMPCPDEGVMHSKMCWFVEKDVREKYDLRDLQLPNGWSYTLMPKRKTDIIKKDKPIIKQSPESKNFCKESPPSKKENNFNITKFTKKMTQEEREKQFSSNNVTNEDKDIPQNQVQPEKKRVSLMFLGPMDKTIKSLQSPSAIQTKCEVNLKDTTLQSPSTSSVSKEENKKRVLLTSLAPLKPDTPKPVRTNLLTQFIQMAAQKYSKTSEDIEKQDECVVLSD